MGGKTARACYKERIPPMLRWISILGGLLIMMGQHDRSESPSVHPSCESERESAHNPTWRAVQIERSKWSNVIRHPPLTTSMMLCSEEVRRPLHQRPVSFLPTSEVQHVNHIDCSFGAVFARWRGLGILWLARLGRTHDERLTRCLTLFSV